MLLQGCVKESALNSALVLLSSMTHLLLSCPDLCLRAPASPTAIPQGSTVAGSGSSDSSVLSNMPCTDHSVSTQLLPGSRMCLSGYRYPL